MIGAEHWSSLRALFHTALEASHTQRAALLDRLRTEDSQLYDELRNLLEETDRLDGFMEAPAAVMEFMGARPGKMLGPYRLIRELGHGGMGTVFEAVRDESDFRQTVAIKVLRTTVAGDDFLRQFRVERRALGQLEHPHVARLINWGVSPDGLCYLVMEYVRDAQPIDRYCAGRQLALDQKLDLFLQVCDAVAHAHRHLVVHRDLKPANILVSKDGSVKLLDFGIAKLLDAGENPTATAGLRLTPCYASPEQVQGGPIATTSDIYSLGVVLFELLTGAPPFDLKGMGIGEAARTIAENSPECPSDALGLAREQRRELKGDLDKIVLMALRKEPGRRYQSVDLLSADIRRYQAGESVGATPDSPVFRLRRLIRRNRASTFLALVAICALVSGAAVATWKWRAAERSRQTAENRYRGLRDFAHEVINLNSEEYATASTADEDRMAAAALRYLNELSHEQSNDRELELDIATALQRVGDAQGKLRSRNLGNVAGAVENYRAAHAILISQWKARSDRKVGEMLLHSYFLLGNVLPDPAAAVRFLADGVELGSRLVARYPDDALFLARAADLAQIRGNRLRSAGDLAAAMESYGQAISLALKFSAIQRDSDYGETLREVNLSEQAVTLRTEGRFAEALVCVSQGYDIAQKLLALSRSPFRRRRAAVRARVLGSVLRGLGRLPEAAGYMRESIQGLGILAAEDHSNEQAKSDLATSIYQMGDIQIAEGKWNDALKSQLEALRLRRSVAEHDASNPLAQRTYAESLNRVANILLSLHGDRRAAMANFAEAARIGEQTLALTPSDIDAVAQVATSYRGQAEIAPQSGDAAGLLRKSADLWLAASNRAPLDVELPAGAQEADKALGKLR